jgi:choline dehydrogenase-like flavoprotein
VGGGMIANEFMPPPPPPTATNPENEVPSSGQHQAGTCRMGTDPATSVTDPYGQISDHPNLRAIDGSLHVTNGGVTRY